MRIARSRSYATALAAGAVLCEGLNDVSSHLVCNAMQARVKALHEKYAPYLPEQTKAKRQGTKAQVARKSVLAL